MVARSVRSIDARAAYPPLRNPARAVLVIYREIRGEHRFYQRHELPLYLSGTIYKNPQSIIFRKIYYMGS